MSWKNHLTKLNSEPYKHFVTKAALFWILRKLKHDVYSEWNCNGGYVDLCDFTTMTIYEVEMRSSPKKRKQKILQYRQPGFEVIVVDCSKMPTDVVALEAFLRDWIIPD